VPSAATLEEAGVVITLITAAAVKKAAAKRPDCCTRRNGNCRSVGQTGSKRNRKVPLVAAFPPHVDSVRMGKFRELPFGTRSTRTPVRLFATLDA
jgi:hypothetical protein